MKTKDCKSINEVNKVEKQHFEARQRSAVYKREVERELIRKSSLHKNQKTLFNFDEEEEDDI